MGKQVGEWPIRVLKNKRKRKETNDEEKEREGESSTQPSKQENPQVTFMECPWPELNLYQVVAPDTLHWL
jgi:hypothetical protein